MRREGGTLPFLSAQLRTDFTTIGVDAPADQCLGSVLIWIPLGILCLSLLVGIIVRQANIKVLDVRVISSIISDEIGRCFTIAPVVHSSCYQQALISVYNVSNLLLCQGPVIHSVGQSNAIDRDSVSTSEFSASKFEPKLRTHAFGRYWYYSRAGYDGYGPRWQVTRIPVFQPNADSLPGVKGLNSRVAHTQRGALQQFERFAREFELSAQGLSLPEIKPRLNYDQQRPADTKPCQVGYVIR